MYRVAAAVLVFLLVLYQASSASAEKRIALVMGNSAYRHAPELANPRNDAGDMAAALRALGVTVIEGTDLDKPGMDAKLRGFASALGSADVGVFFYAGHGLQVNGVNYLVPIDAELSTQAALEFEMVRLDTVQRVMESAAKTNILFLDACRNNPLAPNLARAMGTRSAAIGHGLAPAESGVGTLISFSTQPGNVALDGSGRNSPYAGPLIKAISTPNEDVLSVLTSVRNAVLATTGDKQVPWENHALRARFYFNRTEASLPATPVGVAAQPKEDAAAAEWAGIDKSSPVDLETFISRHGNSAQAAYAKARLAALERERANAAAQDADDMSDEEPERRPDEQSVIRTPALVPSQEGRIEIYAISPNVSKGVHNMRTGPAASHVLVVAIPARATGVAVSSGTCRPPDDGKGGKPWCWARWQGHSGWISTSGLVK